jgi:hypothetical protein
MTERSVRLPVVDLSAPGRGRTTAEGEQLERYRESLLKFRDKYMDFPQWVSVETLALCNAACDFCHYPDMQRKGVRMPDEVFEFIIDDLTRIPHRFGFTPVRVNEPFLDTRLFEFLRLACDRLPRADLYMVTNGTPLVDPVVDRLVALNRVKRLNISFNDHREAEYERAMQLRYGQTLARLDRLHERALAGELNFEVSISRVGDNTPADDAFIAWVRARWSAFGATSHPRADWTGAVDISTDFKVPDVACAQWFKLNILADGKDAFCCLDPTGDHGYGSVPDRTPLELYNAPGKRELREKLTSRLDISVCRMCPILV